MKTFANKLLMLFVITICIGCSPTNKDRYMEQYRDFIDEVADNYQSYSETQWRKAQEKFKNFSEIWYEKFKDDFSTKDQVLIVGYSVKFNYYYAKSQSRDVLDGIMELIEDDGIKEDGSKVINQLEQIFNDI